MTRYMYVYRSIESVLLCETSFEARLKKTSD
jgi:hypothetical protein